MKKDVIISLILVIAWMIVIFILSNMPADVSSSNSSNVVSTVINTVDKVTNASGDIIEKHSDEAYLKNINNIFRKTCHAFCYLALYILVFNFVIRITKKKLLIYNIISFIVCFLYAISDEIHQTFVVGRSGEVRDVLIDSIGIIVGCVFLSIIYTKVKKRRVCHE